MQNGMENANIIYRKIEGQPDPLDISKITKLYSEIFTDADIEFFKQRTSAHLDIYTILAFDNDNLISFKIGYPYNKTTFYSWIGGVKSTYRNQGIASSLAKFQEDFAKKGGFEKLRTKSMNTFKPMMILNLKNGFDIVKFYTNTKGQTKIVFEKNLD